MCPHAAEWTQHKRGGVGTLRPRRLLQGEDIRAYLIRFNGLRRVDFILKIHKIFGNIRDRSNII